MTHYEDQPPNTTAPGCLTGVDPRSSPPELLTQHRQARTHLSAECLPAGHEDLPEPTIQQGLPTILHLLCRLPSIAAGEAIRVVCGNSV